MTRATGIAFALVGLLAARPGDAATVTYDNTGGASSAYYAGQAGAEAVDDIHAVVGGTLTRLRFVYQDPASTGGSFQARISVYDNPGGLDVNLVPLLGPVVVSGLMEGTHTIDVPIANGPVVGSDLWVGIRFTSATAGLVLNDVPSVGSSHDYYWEAGQLYWFGGSPVANFSVQVEVDGTPSAAPTPGVASNFRLGAVRPNPARSATGALMEFSLENDALVRIHVFDAGGRLAAPAMEGVWPAGSHAVNLPTENLRRGIYFIRMDVGGTSGTTRIAILD